MNWFTSECNIFVLQIEEETKRVKFCVISLWSVSHGFFFGGGEGRCSYKDI